MRKASLNVIALLYSESDCSWEEGEYTTDIKTIDAFDAQYFDDFTEACQQWVADMEGKLKNECTYQLIMRHVYEHDGAGATTARYFEVVDVSFQDWHQ